MQDGITKKLQKEFEIADYICVPSSHVKESLVMNGIKEKKILINHYPMYL